ncbi:MAG: c-type cytochrome biogenesis protein CcsB [Micromonosporaceae bacterium]
MPVDPSLGALSDQLLTVTVLCYAVAMLCHAVEYAFADRGAGVAAPELVTAGADSAAADPLAPDSLASDSLVPDSLVPDSRTADSVAADSLAAETGADLEPAGGAVSPGHALLTGKAGVWLTGLGALAQLGCLTARGLAADRVPWGNMYEFTIAVTLVGVVAWLAVAFRFQVRRLGLFVTLTVVLLLGFAAVRLYTEAGPLEPALNSYWLKIHVTTAILATGILMLGFVAAALFLIRDRYDAVGPTRFPVTLGAQLPDAAMLERLAFRLHALAFPIWTFAIMAGAIWAEEAWTRYWGWDPKEVWAFISWVVYAAYLHARATAGWRRSTAAWIAVAGWATMLINLFVVNLVIEGLHSYSDA